MNADPLTTCFECKSPMMIDEVMFVEARSRFSDVAETVEVCSDCYRQIQEAAKQLDTPAK